MAAAAAIWKCSSKPDILIPASEFWDKYAERAVIRRIDLHEVDPVPRRDAFLRDISTEPPAKQQILVSLRDALEELASLGYTPSDILALKKMLSQFEAEKEAAETDRQNYSRRYHDMLQLKQAVRYAEQEVLVKESAAPVRETGTRTSGEVPVSPSHTWEYPSHRWDSSPSHYRPTDSQQGQQH